MTYHTTEELIGGRSEWAVSPNNFNGLIDSHILANQRIAELEAQLAAYQPKDHWSTATKSLVMRLRGIYAVGPNADQMGADDKPEFGWRDYGQRPPIQYEAADRIAALETALQVAREALCLSPTGDDYRLMAISLSGTALKQDMQEHIALYEEKRSKALARIEEEMSRG